MSVMSLISLCSLSLLGAEFIFIAKRTCGSGIKTSFPNRCWVLHIFSWKT
jgi:hypothetical protein